jgi:hypothetical protein
MSLDLICDLFMNLFTSSGVLDELDSLFIQITNTTRSGLQSTTNGAVSLAVFV